ncbi:MAG: TrmJ/YjtD family RNA methyltransferase [Acidobacteria bacterium]|nr:MAG: TrmJ/YjtD family RNA methyltransferase [Acidobacteriota bacterium]RPJ62733.1 MAG: TrmJ/YjtD family RNA methyltransferase [Acidobacteriota bacterium]
MLFDSQQVVNASRGVRSRVEIGRMPARMITKDNVHFILVRTRFASNLGSSARAIKNMGFSNLVLVEPECEVGVEARAYAMKGDEILDAAVFLPSLDEAARRLGYLVGSTGRFREPKPSLVDLRTFVQNLGERFSSSSVGVVFGSEENGLSREELRLCQWLIRIPTDSDYPVMNLAQAVAVVAYEFNLTLSDGSGKEQLLHEAGGEENESFLLFLEKVLQTTAFPEHVRIEKIMKRLRRIAARARLEKEDIDLLRGVLTRFQPKR